MHAILNLTVQYQLDRTFAALADPTRREVLERLGGASATITELAEPFGISLTGMKKHVRVLEDADLVVSEKVGRERRCSLGPRRLDDVHAGIETYRQMLDERLDRFGELSSRRRERQNEGRTAAGEDCDGVGTAFRGTYREVSPPERIVQALEWEGMPGHVAFETTAFEDLGDRTRVTTISLFHTTEERDGMLASGMERGVQESGARLDELLARFVAH